MHENLERNVDTKLPSNRSFGFVFTVIFLAIGLYPLLQGHDPRIWALSVGLLFLIISIIQPTRLAPLNRAWTRLGLILGKVFNPVILGVLFFFVICPIGVMKRFLSSDFLSLKYSSEKQSYWIDRKPPGPEPESLRQQF
ncbi:MAG: hypothetical protein G3M78_07830 [Candidatus Nitrohelix vancouverensis]|uniref:SxtJ n=1 Tax=Candidatus Nitrohelix vancouverensis TaxID=2705534 RepID=A0A7T0C2Q0_9BACT|nr:MAG: hypothetical protein G3M78_07830 [Candidatus Nitrohelix vancouverensis]